HQPSRRRSLLPHFFAIAALIATYVLVILATDQQMLAFALSASAALGAFILCRLIQLRGKLTLSLTVIGLPFLVALMFASLLALNPFYQRQRSVTMLRDVGLSYMSRGTTQQGEWKRDLSGNMLPTWIADQIGPDSMSEINTIMGDLESLQSIPYRDLTSNQLKRFYLDRQNTIPTVSTDLIAWINRLDTATVYLELHHYADADGRALNQLKLPLHLNLHLSPKAGDLSLLTQTKTLHIHGDMLSPTHAQQLSQIDGIAMLSLSLLAYPADMLRQLDQPRATGSLRLAGGKIDPDAWPALANLRWQRIDLEKISLASLKDAAEHRSNHVLPFLSVSGPTVSIDDVHQLIHRFQCVNFQLHHPLTHQEIESLWEHPQLQSVRIFDGNNEWITHDRPSK
ncbi:MAG: hypothetical protein HKN47_15470, partial [Pirellulaceae bacterium]|nr:hypothetical protein [Pirellulaceae bacterium]